MNYRTPLRALATLILIATAPSCKKSSTSTSTSTSSYTPTCSGTSSYKTDVQPLMKTYCISCHSEYSSYSGVSRGASSIRQQVTSGKMPEGSTLTEAQKNSIVCWIDAGASNN